MGKESPSVIEMIAQWSQLTYRLKVSRYIMDSHQPLEIPVLDQVCFFFIMVFIKYLLLFVSGKFPSL